MIWLELTEANGKAFLVPREGIVCLRAADEHDGGGARIRVYVRDFLAEGRSYVAVRESAEEIERACPALRIIKIGRDR